MSFRDWVREITGLHPQVAVMRELSLLWDGMGTGISFSGRSTGWRFPVILLTISRTSATEESFPLPTLKAFPVQRSGNSGRVTRSQHATARSLTSTKSLLELTPEREISSLFPSSISVTCLTIFPQT